MGRKPELLPVVHQEIELDDCLHEEEPINRVKISDDGLNGIALAYAPFSAEAWLQSDDWYPVDMFR